MRKATRKRRMQQNHHAANILGEIKSQWLSHFQPILHFDLDSKGLEKEQGRKYGRFEISLFLKRKF